MKLLIVDGSNLLFQMFVGMPSRITGKDGCAIQGTLGFVGALLKIIRLTNPTHIIVLFDGEHENARAEINSDYKANRPNFTDIPDEDNPFSQLPDIYSAFNYIGIKQIEIADCETDDVVASYAIKFSGQMKIVISSFDSDFFQLITDKVNVLRYRGKATEICDTQYVIEKFGVTPSEYADFKSLTGDTYDNIKGADKNVLLPPDFSLLGLDFAKVCGVNIARRVRSDGDLIDVVGDIAEQFIPLLNRLHFDMDCPASIAIFSRYARRLLIFVCAILL